MMFAKYRGLNDYEVIEILEVCGATPQTLKKASSHLGTSYKTGSYNTSIGVVGVHTGIFVHTIFIPEKGMNKDIENLLEDHDFRGVQEGIDE